MSDTPDANHLRLQILQVLEQTPDGQDLAAIHVLLNRSRRDASIMLPVMGALVSGGYLEKVSVANPGFPNANLGPARTGRRGEPSPPRFRLTDAGRMLLQDARTTSQPIAPASLPVGALTSDDAATEHDDVAGDAI